jgi:hypothetical protein
MSQENSKTEKTQEMRKKILLGALLVVLVGVLYYQFFWESAAPVTTTTAAPIKNATDSVKTSVAAARTTPRPGETPEQIISQPLDLASMSGKSAQDAGTGRNIFVYPPPPPPPTPKPIPTAPPLPPPPILVSSVNPAGVVARTGDFPLTVFGDKIPQDAQGFVDGREYPTTFVSNTEIKIKVPGAAIRTPGNLGVMIRSKSDAALYSNQYSLNVAEPPAPQYRYVGLIINKNGAMAVLKSQSDDEIINVRKNSTFGEGRWRVVNITPQKIEIEDTILKLDTPHTIFFTGENG